jgi:exodeoxyribonuclease VII small subunit
MAQKKPLDYKELNNELDDILDQLQNPETDIDEALLLYARGQKVVKELEQYLKTAENSVKKLSRKAAG